MTTKECFACGINLNFDCIHRYSKSIAIDICDSCAQMISSAYESWHGGISSSNQPQLKGQRKKKLSAKLSLSVFRRDGFKCKTCGSSDDLSVDHIYPESLGGESCISNLQTLCRSCNSKKGVKNEVV